MLFEDGQRLVLFGGIRPEWFTNPAGVEVERAPTYFGLCSLKYKYDVTKGKATLELSGSARPPGGFVLRLPSQADVRVSAQGRDIERQDNGDFILPANTAQATIKFSTPGT